MKMYKNIVLPAGILAGTIIGAGVFALPYLFLKAGILTGLFYLTIFTIAFVLIHLMYADVVLGTAGDHRFAGYAQIYLGKFARWASLLITIIGMILVLTVYLILSISFIHLIFPKIAGTDDLIAFWLLSSLAVFLGVKKLALAEILSTYGIAAIMLIILSYGLVHIGRFIEAPLLNLNSVFLPYGAILFSLSGRVAIPALVDYFKKDPELTSSGRLKIIGNAKWSIIIGTVFSALLYLIFIIGVFGASASSKISPDSVAGLVGHLPTPALYLFGLLGLISMWSTYIVIGYDVLRSLKFDFRFSALLANIIIIFAPIFLYFTGLKNFIPLVSLIGGVFLGLEALLIVLMWRRLPKISEGVRILKPNRFLTYALLLIFILGIILTLVG